MVVSVELISLVIAFFGILLAFISIVLTYITFFAPLFTARYALRDQGRWSEITISKPGHKFLRHEVFSGFSIEIDFSSPVTDNFFEPWMNALYRPDRGASSYYVTMFFNGLPILTELFVSYDGNRNFIPAPKIKKLGSRYYLHFDQMQRLLAQVVGSIHIEGTVEQIFKKILSSRYNPVVTEFDVADSTLTIAELERKITSFKKRAQFFTV